jgi:coenzyme F420-0:L-glutamate ligase/coenzyme F420-1:gamma-L-glutamate ligase
VTTRRPLSCHAIPGLPSIRPGDDLAALLVAAVRDAGLTLEREDVVAVCRRSSRRPKDASSISPRSRRPAFSARLAADTDKDPRVVEVILRETTRIVRMSGGHPICETGPGWVCANAGIDESNSVQPDSVTLLPLDADASAERLRVALSGAAGGAPIGIVITDTFGRPWRDGSSTWRSAWPGSGRSSTTGAPPTWVAASCITRC